MYKPISVTMSYLSEASSKMVSKANQFKTVTL